MKNVYCPMIHGGLNINLKANNALSYNQCCLSTKQLDVPESIPMIWDSKNLADLRAQNNNELWDKDCWECERLENAGHQSFRQGLISKFGVRKNLSGPLRIDLLFDRSCNLACMTCGPESSTLWERQLKDNNLPVGKYFNNKNSIEIISNILKSLDLSNLEMVQFCGGETLLGNTYWKTAKLISELVPDAKDKITLAFQTNGTQAVDERYHDIIDKFHLVKFFISLDGTQNRFEYLRWPASWNQVVDNIMSMRETIPVNTMFFIQEVTSCLNLFYYDEVPDWINKNFSTNRLGDPVEYTTQLAMHKYLGVNNITQEYFDAIKNTSMRNVLQNNWSERPAAITAMLNELDKFDKIRNQNWHKTFPEVAEFYRRYL